MRRLTRFFNTWAAVTRIHRYADQQHEWTEEDRQALAAFLRSPAGAKMERLMVDRWVIKGFLPQYWPEFRILPPLPVSLLDRPCRVYARPPIRHPPLSGQ